jgi:D-xylose transport system ATP-binding protein
MPPLLEASQLTKRFPGVVALDRVNFDLRAGEVHALCGENGAGKSTLIKLLSGIHPHGSYEGELRVDGRPVAFHGIRDAEAAGIAVITQELALVDELGIAENIFLGRPPRRGLRVDWLEMQRQAAVLLADFGLALPPDLPVRRLGIGQKQLIEIVRAMDKKSRVLVLDEPSAALTEKEVAVLLDHLRRLRAQGTACIYISHKLDEVFALADRITVLRDGASITTLARARATIPLVIKHMVGRELGDLFPRRPGRVKTSSPGGPVASADVTLPRGGGTAPPSDGFPNLGGRVPSPATDHSIPNPAADRGSRGEGTAPPPDAGLLTVRGLHVAPSVGEPDFLRDISFEVRAGEVLGFGGLMGAGRTELLMHLFGAWGRRTAGEVRLHGTPYDRPTPRDSIRLGLVLASEDRRRHGLVLGQPIGFNLSLSSLPRFTRAGGRLDLPAEYLRNQGLFDSLRVKAPGQHARVGGLSGGNQQKVVLGKALMTEPSVVMLDEPTRGIDVGAKLEVYELINRLTAEGKAVLLVSSELPELMGMSDRILMLCEGRIGGSFVAGEFTQERLLAAAMGQANGGA